MSIRFVAVVLLGAILLCDTLPGTEAISLSRFISRVTRRLGNFEHVRCASRELWQAYQQLRNADCLNCDKYFHCIGNYNAVYSCGGTFLARATAAAISNFRELLPGQSGPDSSEDQEANRCGRRGCDCASQYICQTPNRCSYSPSTHTCARSNCNN